MSQSLLSPPKYTNALAKETSPYLLQHAHNPVNWFPWGPEAFVTAKHDEKPIFLSIGYSSCHWCHVMEHESFENEDVASILNQHFVAIKVDREERPDIDEIYMAAVQLVTERGGWPASIFLTPSGNPFFGGTYFPREDSYGRMGFKTLLRAVAKAWAENREQVLLDAEALSEGVRQYVEQRRIPAELPLGKELLDNAIRELRRNFDPVNGGFGDSPKFPPNNALPLLLFMKAHSLGGQSEIDGMITLTLDRMARGGIHDHLAGGFHRYSTDERWLLPHFEKMLYDNALLARSYAQASALYGNAEYARIARRVYDWVLRDMTAPEGGFYSSLDADSGGQEGQFYVWDKREVDALLGPDSEAFCAVFDVRSKGNFTEEATDEETGRNILHLNEPLSVHAARMGISEDHLRAKVERWTQVLLAERVKRPGPGLDDKVLTAWNALMISSLARGSIWLKEPRYREAAVKAAEFLLCQSRTPDGRWLASWRQGQAKLPAYQDDYAFLAVAFLDLREATGDERWTKSAMEVVELMERHFANKSGGYYFTADDHEALLARTKNPVDKAIPAGNGYAAQALVRLYAQSGDERFLDRARALFSEFQGLIERAPQATESLLLGVAKYVVATASAGAPPTAQHPVAKVHRGPVSVEFLLGQHVLRRGQTFPLEVQFEIQEGAHIRAGGVVPASVPAGETLIELADEQPWELSQLVYPEPKTDPATHEKRYVETVIVTGVIKVAGDAPTGAQTVRVRVHFQACDENICYGPEDVTLSVAVEVAAGDAHD
ncbi:MAG TPA: DUF255 domain-containing protein [Planctomycetota bacterium]|jgi:hypothetical protein